MDILLREHANFVAFTCRQHFFAVVFFNKLILALSKKFWTFGWKFYWLQKIFLGIYTRTKLSYERMQILLYLLGNNFFAVFLIRFFYTEEPSRYCRRCDELISTEEESKKNIWGMNKKIKQFNRTRFNSIKHYTKTFKSLYLT